MSDLSVLRIGASDGFNSDRGGILFDFRGQRIAVSVFPNTTTQNAKKEPVTSHLLRILEQTSVRYLSANQYKELGEEALGIIVKADPRFFSQRPVDVEGNENLHSHRDKHSILYPKTLCWQLIDEDDGSAKLVNLQANKSYIPLPDDKKVEKLRENSLELNPKLPSYSTRDIRVNEILAECTTRTACRVEVDGMKMFCKAWTSGMYRCHESVILREINCLQKVLDLELFDQSTRIPKILGYVRNAETWSVTGFLREWVPGRQLQDVDILQTPIEEREKWGLQIYEEVKLLHQHNIVWGDAKPKNVIIDKASNACLIDFGSLVGDNLMNTMEGDLQAVKRIADFLKISIDF